jgi:hypothetical protein
MEDNLEVFKSRARGQERSSKQVKGVATEKMDWVNENRPAFIFSPAM